MGELVVRGALLPQKPSIMRMSRSTSDDEVIDRERGNGAYYLLDGNVYSWGYGLYGENGNSSNEHNLKGKAVKGLPNGRILKVDESGYALTDSGEVYSWGSGYKGSGSSGVKLTASKVLGLGHLKIIDIVGSGYFGGYALTDSGEVYSWGDGRNGRNGNGSEEDCLIAVKVLGLDGVKVRAVLSKSLDTPLGAFVLTEDGDVYAWGSGDGGSNGSGLEDDSLIATRVQGLPKGAVTEVLPREGYGGAFAITKDSDVYSWGSGQYAANGNGTGSDNLVAELVKDLPPKSVVSLTTRNMMGAYAITRDGSIYSWGAGYSGANGNGTTQEALTATRVLGLNGLASKVRNRPVDQAGLGGIALTDSGVYSWGAGGVGGWNGNDGSTDNLIADKVRGIDSKIVDVTARGEYGGYALDYSGEVYSWGVGSEGQNGNNSGASNRTAELVKGFNDIIELIDRYEYGAYAIDSNDSIFSVGRGKNGANGNGSEENNLIGKPVLIDYLPAIKTRSLPPVTQGEAYSFQLDGYSYNEATWGAEGLPAGLSISSSGLITGVPTEVGDFSVKVVYTNENGPTEKNLKLLVEESPAPVDTEAEDETALLLGLI